MAPHLLFYIEVSKVCTKSKPFLITARQILITLVREAEDWAEPEWKQGNSWWQVYVIRVDITTSDVLHRFVGITVVWLRWIESVSAHDIILMPRSIDI